MFLLQNKGFKAEDREMAEILADKYPGPGEELLLWAAEKGHDAVVRRLLGTDKADVDAPISSMVGRRCGGPPREGTRPS